MKKKRPALRFSGFDNDWEQRKLGDVADKVIEKNADLTVQETFTNSAEFGVVSQRDFFDHDITNVNNIGGYYVVKNEDFVYNPRISVTAPVGPVNRNKLGRDGVISPLYTVFRTHDIDTTYLDWFFKSGYWHSFMYFNGDSGARSDRFSIKDSVFFEMPIPMPTLKEQRKIGAWMDSLDHLITLHRCECKKLICIKKSMLENMFPQKGEKIPRIRFSGFTDDWEQRKLGEVLQTLPFENFIKTPEQDGEYEIIQQGNEPILGFAKGMPCTDYRDVVIFGDHTMSLYKPHQPFFIATDGVRIIKGKQKMDGFYLMAMLERYRPQSEGYKRYYSILTNTECFFTENWTEQQQIGIYFRQLDHLITLHQRKLEKLQNIKKAMLEKMFV
ncbi:hypothetical protein HMPREF1986_01539 [Oribacterium sp. oral taxon 078 str. F0263]|uniref:restriction endonuclease subunit S n=1 Tax=Oribacterium sp. oral taxon 078 TaxID=652706 RepID=UPI0003AD7D89|nr:restriction endonuclease subunit S [Oribacterium sp. oral taxon 078]ERL21357.1 hypothetical protein HMPREF1986_01539 [Oribacterium sp. oral taxon 078 str. F0263]